MKDFLRALRFSWQYRRRLILSICCAMVAAALWGLNFTAVYPVLKIVGDRKTLHEWVDDRIDAVEKEIEHLSTALDAKRKRLKGLDSWPDKSLREREEHETASQIARFESKLDSATSR